MTKKYYENLKDAVLGDLTSQKSITRQDIVDSIMGQYRIKKGRDSDFFISPKEFEKLQAEVEYHFNVSISEKDSSIYSDDYVHTTWWDESDKRNNGYYWESCKKYLECRENLPKDVVEKISERSDSVMNHLFNPLTNEPIKKYGMVIGSVQSGKTSNYIALVSKAADAGFKIIIVIAGSSKILRQQTQIRIDKGFVGQYDANYEDEDAPVHLIEEGTVAEFRRRDKREREERRPCSMTNSKLGSDFNTTSAKTLQQTNLNNTTAPLVFVIKKNVTVIQQVVEWLKGKDKSSGSLLLIDDEADNASINTRKDYLNESTAINKGIKGILKEFDRFAYIGFTATPFANVFIDPLYSEDDTSKDLFPKDFIVSLESPDNYLGPDYYFGEDGEVSDHVNLLADPDTNEASNDWEKYFPLSQKKGVSFWNVTGIPKSLKKAIINFCFNIAIRNIRGFENQHNTMLVHVSRLVDMHEATAKQIRIYLEHLSGTTNCYYRMKGSEDYERYITPLKDLFDDLKKKSWNSNNSYGVCQFDDVLERLPSVLQSIDVQIANAKENSVSYSSYHQTNVIMIGGNALSRGYTLQNLSVSYFIRNTCMCDTLLQMGRWFGYRYYYDDLCTVYIPSLFASNFSEANQASHDLIRCVGKMVESDETPERFLITVSQHPATQMLLTARNKMRNASKDEGVFLDGRLTEKGTYEREDLHNCNYIFQVKKFLRKLGRPESAPVSGKHFYRWLNVPACRIVELVKDCPNAFNVRIDSSLLQEYISQNSNFKWRVVIPSLKSGKSFDFEELKINKIKRENKNDKTKGTRLSFSVTDIENEKMGLLEDENKKLYDGSTITRCKCRAVRTEPLLIINIADLYEEDYRNFAPIEEDFPFLSLSFAGSFSSPVFKPLKNFRFNKAVSDWLKLENENESETDDCMEDYDA